MYACLLPFIYCYQSINVISFSLSHCKRHLLCNIFFNFVHSMPSQLTLLLGTHRPNIEFTVTLREVINFFVFLTCIFIFSVFCYHIFLFCHANDLEEHFVIQEGTFSQNFEQDFFCKERNPGKNSFLLNFILLFFAGFFCGFFLPSFGCSKCVIGDRSPVKQDGSKYFESKIDFCSCLLLPFLTNSVINLYSVLCRQEAFILNKFAE